MDIVSQKCLYWSGAKWSSDGITVCQVCANRGVFCKTAVLCIFRAAGRSQDYGEQYSVPSRTHVVVQRFDIHVARDGESDRRIISRRGHRGQHGLSAGDSGGVHALHLVARLVQVPGQQRHLEGKTFRSLLFHFIPFLLFVIHQYHMH